MRAHGCNRQSHAPRMINAARNQKLTEEEVQALLADYAKTADVSTRDCIVLQYTNLVESIARRFAGACEPLEDLVQEGYIGLITSVDLYDPTKGVKFSTYATHFVIGQIKHYLRDKGKIIKEPAWLQELNQRMTRVIESLSQKHGRSPTEKEIAAVMDLPEDTVVDMLTTREVFKVSSLDAGIEREDGSLFPVDTEKIRDNKCTTFQLPIEDRIVLETAMERLKGIEQRVIQEFFFQDHNQTEIAKKLDISCNYVSHILRNSTKKLKKILMTEEIRDAHIQMAQNTRRTQDVRAQEDVSVIDSSTGVYNQPYLLNRTEEEISRAHRQKHELSLLFIRILLPESVGELTRVVRTDDILQQAADRLKCTCRRGDVLARYSEDIFGLLLPYTGETAEIVADRMRCAIEKQPFQGAGPNNPIHAEVTTSWSTYPNPATDTLELVNLAFDGLGLDEDTTQRKAA